MLKRKEPTLIFRGGDRVGGHQIKLENMFPVQFPFGVGGLHEKRPTKVSTMEVIRHYVWLSLPQFQRADFILVLYAMYQRVQSFQNSIITCKTKLNNTTLGEALSTITAEQLEETTTQVLAGRGQQTSNATMNKVFHSISANCKDVGHSNEAASVARSKIFAIWQYFGPPAIFATASPCDENSMRVRLYATSQTHKLPTLEQCMDEEDCFLDLKMRRDWRSTYPGACSLEYQSLMQVFIQVLIGWDKGKQCGKNGIFGKPLAWTEACEEQSRLTLHSHLLIWIKYFNIVRDLLYHSDMEVQIEAKKRLVHYFEKIGQATLGDLVVTVPDDNGNMISSSPNTSLKAPTDQDIREMRHHVYCKQHDGAVGYHVPFIQAPSTPHYIPRDPQPVNPSPNALRINTLSTLPSTHPFTSPFTTTATPRGNPYSVTDIVESNTRYCLPCNVSNKSFTDTEIDRLAYMMPYHMKQNPNLRPSDCRDSTISYQTQSPLEQALLSYELRNPLFQL